MKTLSPTEKAFPAGNVEAKRAGTGIRNWDWDQEPGQEFVPRRADVQVPGSGNSWVMESQRQVV